MNSYNKNTWNGGDDLQQKLEDEEQECSLNYSTLKQKIIQTDVLIQRYVAKSQENNHLGKRLEDVSLVVDQLRRECSKSEDELEKSLRDSELLRKTLDKLEEEKQSRTINLRTLQDRLAASEKLVQQYEMLLKQKEEKEKDYKDYDQLMKEKLKKEKLLDKAKDDGVTLYQKLQSKGSKLKKVNALLHRTTEHLINFGNFLDQKGIISRGQKKILSHYRALNEKGKNLNSSEDEEEEDGAAKVLEDMLLNCKVSDMCASSSDTSDTEQQSSDVFATPPKKVSQVSPLKKHISFKNHNGKNPCSKTTTISPQKPYEVNHTTENKNTSGDHSLSLNDTVDDSANKQNQYIIPTVQSALTSNQKSGNALITDISTQDKQPLSDKTDSQHQKNGAHSLVDLSDQEIPCNESCEKSLRYAENKINDLPLSHGTHENSLCYLEHNKNSDTSVRIRDIDKESHYASSNEVVFQDEHILKGIAISHSKEGQDCFENEINDICESHEVKKYPLSTVKNNTVEKIMDYTFIDDVRLNKSLPANLNCKDSNIDKEKLTDLEKAENISKNQHVLCCDPPSCQVNDQFDINNDLDVIRSQMCLQAECLSPLSPLPPTPPPLQDINGNSPKKSFPLIHSNSIANRKEEISSQCELQENDSEAYPRESFDTKLSNADMYSSDSSSVSKIHRKKKLIRLSKLKEFKNNEEILNEPSKFENCYDSKQYLSHQQSEGFEVSDNFGMPQHFNLNKQHSMFPNKPYVHCNAQHEKKPSYDLEGQNMISNSGSSRLQANFSHSAEDGQFKVSVRLPNRSSKQNKASVTSLFLELDTQTKELSLSWCPEIRKNDTENGEQERAVQTSWNSNFKGEPKFKEDKIKEFTRSSPKSENFGYYSKIPLHCKKHKNEDYTPYTVENWSKNTRKMSSPTKSNEHKFNSKELSPNCTDILREKHLTAHSEQISKYDSRILSKPMLLDSYGKQTYEVKDVSPETVVDTCSINQECSHLSPTHISKCILPVTNTNITPMKTQSKSISSEIHMNSGSPFKKRFSLSQWNNTTHDGLKSSATPAISSLESRSHTSQPDTGPSLGQSTDKAKSPENLKRSLQQMGAGISNTVCTVQSEHLIKKQKFGESNTSQCLSTEQTLNKKLESDSQVHVEQLPENEKGCTDVNKESISEVYVEQLPEDEKNHTGVNETLNKEHDSHVKQPSENEKIHTQTLNKKPDSQVLVEQPSENVLNCSLSWSNISNKHFWTLRLQKKKVHDKFVEHLSQMKLIKECPEKKSQLLNIVCMIENPLVIPSVDVAIASILQHLMSFQSNPYQNNSSLPPIMLDMEKYLVAIVLHAERKQKSHLSNLIGGLQVALLSQIFAKNKVPPYKTASLCRVYTALFKQMKNIKKPRILCYDLFYKGLDMASFLVAAVVGVWPEVIYGTSTTKGQKCPLNKVLVYSFFKKMRSLPQSLQHYCKQVLEHCCKIKETPIRDPTILANDLLEDMKTRQKSDVYEYIKALELIAAGAGWEWTNDVLVRCLLWPLLQKWSMKQENPSEPAISDFEAAALVKLLGCLGWLCPKEKRMCVQNIMLPLKMLLIRSSEVSFCVQEAAFSSLLHLLPFGHTLVSSVLDSWLKQNEVQLMKANTNRLLEVTIAKKVLASVRHNKHEDNTQQVTKSV